MSFEFNTFNRKQEIVAELITTTINGNNILKDETYSKMVKQIRTKDIWEFANLNEVPYKIWGWDYKKANAIKSLAEYFTGESD